jgi:hypothetical protein
VYNNTLATVKHRIQQAENPTPAMVVSMEAALDDNAILLDYLTSEVILEEPDIRSTDLTIPINTKGMDKKYHVMMPAGSGDYDDQGDESDLRNAIPIARWR